MEQVFGSAEDFIVETSLARSLAPAEELLAHKETAAVQHRPTKLPKLQAMCPLALCAAPSLFDLFFGGCLPGQPLIDEVITFMRARGYRGSPEPACLWIAGRYPYPRQSGLESYSTGVLCATAAAGVRITVVCLANADHEDAPKPHGVTWEIVDAVRKHRVSSLVSRLPAMAHSLRTRALRSKIRALLEQQPWDAIVIDHLQTGWALADIAAVGASRRPVIIYLSQNYESAVRRDIVMGSSPRQLVLRWDGLKVSRLEANVMRQADAVTAITTHDLELFRGRVAGIPVVLLPPGYDGTRVDSRAITEATPRRAVVVGNFSWHVKQENLRRLLRAADPWFAAAGAELRVIGSVPDHLLAQVAPHLQATTFAGVVDSLDQELAQARVGIVAERFGGGFKMKALDYIFHRVPVALLTENVAGLPLEAGRSCLAFPDEEALAVGVVGAIDDLATLDALQRAAYEASRDAFDWATRGARLRELILDTAH